MLISSVVKIYGQHKHSLKLVNMFNQLCVQRFCTVHFSRPIYRSVSGYKAKLL